jgi:hypothetical protein
MSRTANSQSQDTGFVYGAIANRRGRVSDKREVRRSVPRGVAEITTRTIPVQSEFLTHMDNQTKADDPD